MGHRNVWIVFGTAALLLCVSAASARAGEPAPRKAERGDESLTVQVYLVREVTSRRPWQKRTAPPPGYSARHVRASIECYLPDHKLAHRLGTKAFFAATPDRYKARLRARPDTRAYVPRARPLLPVVSFTLFPQLTLTDEARTELMRKLSEHLEANANGK